jgi:NAD(P)-dependent dehydrogenase (short-subunit alcohol dehydrogenase family)
MQLTVIHHEAHKAKQEPIRMQGKVCLVTGATSGIGQITARELARLGARVIIVGRSPEKTEATLRQIREGTGATAIESMITDLSSQAGVRQLAEQVRARCDRLDVLVNNAGAMFLKPVESVDGIEMTLALNHLSYFLLTNLLLPLLEASAPSRIVTVASDAHKGVSLDFDDLQGKKKYGGWRAYQRSKLANILFTNELARRLDGTKVTANSLHPGFVRTNLLDVVGNRWRGWLIRAIADRIALSPEKGARTSIYLASSSDVAGVTGRYFVKEKPVASSPQSRVAADAQRLWQISEEMTGHVGA